MTTNISDSPQSDVVTADRPSVTRNLPRAKSARGRRIKIFLVSGALLSVCLAWLYPLVWMVASSLKTNAEVFDDQGLFSSVIHLENYARAWTEARIGD